MKNWDTIFARAHLDSWPAASLSIQNVNPSPSQGSRNIFNDDQREIMAAAAKHGYRPLSSLKAKVVSFIRP